MSVSIRLARIGKKNAPAYRVVVTKTKTKRNGKFIDIIGNYNPSDPTTELTIDKKKYKEWVENGAIVSDAVKKLVDGKYEYVKYNPKAAKPEEKEEKAEESTEEAPEDTPAEE